MTKKQRQEQLRRRSLYVALGFFLGAASMGGLKAAIDYDNNHFSLDEVQNEIDIHAGIGLDPDGHRIDPYLDHGCEVPNDGRTFEERLADRMYQEGYNQKTIEAAVEKFEYEYNKDFDSARDINLKQIEKEAKEEKMMARGR